MDILYIHFIFSCVTFSYIIHILNFILPKTFCLYIWAYIICQNLWNSIPCGAIYVLMSIQTCIVVTLFVYNMWFWISVSWCLWWGIITAFRIVTSPVLTNIIDLSWEWNKLNGIWSAHLLNTWNLPHKYVSYKNNDEIKTFEIVLWDFFKSISMLNVKLTCFKMIL